ncbi:MAG: hypothetical protein QOI35_4085, partial [Cryptosporangiaceae bacterium]|nr:hypothetical protein [Cryptosporangiaceae bacterium]
HGEAMPLRRTGDGGFVVTDRGSGRRLWFAPPDGEGAALLTAITGDDQHRIDVSRDGSGVPTEVRHSAGYAITVGSADGLVTALTAGGEVLRAFRYGEHDQLTGIVNASGLAMTYDYDDAGRIARWDDRNGMWYRYEYDSAGRCVATEGRDGYFSYTFSYDPVRLVTRATGSLGHTTTFELNENLQVVATTDPLGGVVRTGWDDQHRLRSRVDQLGRATYWEHDGNGNVRSVTLPDGSSVLLDYDVHGEPIEIAGPDGGRWQFDRDSNGELVRQVDPAGTELRYTDALAEGTDPARVHWLGRRPTVDASGQPVAFTDAAGQTHRITRDRWGRPVSAAWPGKPGGETRYEWTADGDLATRTAPDGTSEHRSYDAEGNLIALVDERGGVTSVEYSWFDLAVAETDPAGARTEYGWDTELRLVSVTNPLGQVWRYSYDPAGRMSGEIDFDGREYRYGYDAAGQLIRAEQPDGTVTEYAYDLLGNLAVQRTGAEVATYSWTAAGLLTSAATESATVRLDRDPAGRLVAETIDGRTVAVQRDPVGRPASLRMPSGVGAEWHYDPMGRPTALLAAGHVLWFGYDEAGREAWRQSGDAAVVMHEYDWAGRLSAQTLVGGDLWGEPRLLEQRQIQRTGGDVAAIRERIGGGREYTTEITGRIVEVRGGSGTEEYGYDALGNVTRAAGSAAAPGPRTFAGTLIAEAGGYSYRHDGNGRLTARGSAATGQWLHEWDAAGRMTGVVCPDGSRWRYHYDPLGRRIAKERLAADNTPAERIEFSWLGFRLTEQVHTAADGTRSVTTWLYHPVTGHLAAQVRDGRLAMAVTDELGTPTELIDPDGELAWRRDAPLWGADGSTELLLRFPGQYYDAETGLHYNVHRYYDPVTARYTSPDPLGLMPAPNPVAYVPNPLAAADPLGLWHCTEYNGVFPRNDYVHNVGPHGQTQGFSQQFVRESEHVMPMAAVRGSGIPSLGPRSEITISIPYWAHRGAVSGAGGGISSTGRGTVASGWSGDLAAMLRNGDFHGAYANAILDQLNVSIHSAGALCHYLDHVRDMTLPAGAAPRLTHAEVANLQGFVQATYWRRMGPTLSESPDVISVLERNNFDPNAISAALNISPAHAGQLVNNHRIESSFVNLAQSGLSRGEIATRLGIGTADVDALVRDVFPHSHGDDIRP